MKRQICKSCLGASGSRVIMQDTKGNSHGECVPCWKGDFDPRQVNA